MLLFLVWVPAAYTWSWPVQGPVLQPFVYDESHPYASGQHRGIDIGADGVGEQVVAPAAGTVTFAGSVPTSGQCVTIQTPDGYSVTLTHLGSILVAKGASVAERDPVGTIGPSGSPEFDQPYVHLGIRSSSDPDGYVDPLVLLPQPAQSAPAQTTTTASQPSVSGSSSAPPQETAPASSAAQPAARTRPARATTVAKTQKIRTRASSQPRHGETARVARPSRSSKLPASHPAQPASPRVRRHVTKSHHHSDAATTSTRRPVVEPAVPVAPIRVEARSTPVERGQSAVLAPLACNGAAALVALAAALAAGRCSRRRRSPVAGAQVLRLPRTEIPRRHERHAA